jgi:ATP-binding cassette subfamily B (MDR/TAP) protein 1
MCVCTFAYMYIWVYTGELNAKRIRENYLKAILRQDIAFFDKVGAGEVATRIQTDTRRSISISESFHAFVSRLFLLDLVQQGTSEKVALVVHFVAAFITGFALAYARSWRLSLALTAIVPCMVITGALMGKFLSRYMQYVFVTFLISFHEP